MEKQKEQKQQKKQIPLSPAVQSAVNAFRLAGEQTDPDGWYTGVPREAKGKGQASLMTDVSGEKAKDAQPIQDVDDL